MRIKIAKVVTFVVVLLNLIALYSIWKLLAKNDRQHGESRPKPHVPSPIYQSSFTDDSVTLIIRKFEYFENDVADTVQSFISIFPNLRVLVVSDTIPYPPIDLKSLNFSSSVLNRVKIFDLQFKLTNSLEDSNPISQIKTKYSLFVPDSTRSFKTKTLRRIIEELKADSSKILAITYSDKKYVDCLQIKLSIREWRIQYSTINGDVCDAVSGKHLILLETQILSRLPAPFMLPFPDALYIQTSAKNIKVKLLHDAEINDGKPLYQSQHLQWKIKQLDLNRQQLMFQQLGFKKVLRETGAIEWYGCNRNAPRCFSTVIDDVPQYLWEGKWTPPCCLAGLRRTAHHVFARLEEFGVRYWLEGGSLLGAMRSGDILPWDYDVDVGIYKEDIRRCPWLAQAQSHSPVVDEGYVWEKAREGNFFRVQFSHINHLHVDLFPFYSRNGTMTKDTWFRTHKQDREFPEHFLRPLSSIEFLGKQVSAPNNIRDFLELKFGKGAIETPEYPNSKVMKYLLNNGSKNPMLLYDNIRK